MKSRRDFLKFLGIGAAACIPAAIAIVAGRGGTPTTPPRTLPEMERVKTYEGPDDFPGGDFIKRKPDIIRDINPIPEIQKIGPDVNVFPDAAMEKMLDNVFNVDPFYQYLTTTGTQVMDNDRTFTIDNNTLITEGLICASPEMLTWKTAWETLSLTDGSSI